jgi:hypothetical protein
MIKTSINSGSTLKQKEYGLWGLICTSLPENQSMTPQLISQISIGIMGGGVTRGFCTLIMNTKYADGHVMTELEKALGLDLSFLLEPEYFDPESGSEIESEEFTTSDSGSDDQTGVDIELFLEKLKGIQHAIIIIEP